MLDPIIPAGHPRGTRARVTLRLVPALAIVVLGAQAGLAMGGRPKGPPVEGTGAGTVVLHHAGQTLSMPWIYATVVPPLYKVAAANTALEQVAEWGDLPAGTQQIMLTAELAPDAKPPYRKAHFRSFKLSMSWGPSRAVATAAWDEARQPGAIAALKWLDLGTMTGERFTTRFEVPKGVLRAQSVTLEFDVDLTKAHWAG